MPNGPSRCMPCSLDAAQWPPPCQHFHSLLLAVTVTLPWPQLGPFFVLKFVRSRVWGQISLTASKVLSDREVQCKHKKMAGNSRQWPLIAVNGR